MASKGQGLNSRLQELVDKEAHVVAQMESKRLERYLHGPEPSRWEISFDGSCHRAREPKKAFVNLHYHHSGSAGRGYTAASVPCDSQNCRGGLGLSDDTTYVLGGAQKEALETFKIAKHCKLQWSRWGRFFESQYELIYANKLHVLSLKTS